MTRCLSLSTIAFTGLFLAGCRTSPRLASWDHVDSCCAGACAAHQADALEWFKNLEGTWVSDKPGLGGRPMTLKYHSIGSGTAVCETLFPGTEHEMVTMYHLHFKRLVATHYCAMGNQPRMLGMACLRTHEVKFVCVDATNVDPGSGEYMGQMEYTFIDNDTLNARWHHLKAGHVDAGMNFNYHRQK